MQGFGDIAVISIEHLNSYNMKKVILKVGLMLLAVGQFTGAVFFIGSYLGDCNYKLFVYSLYMNSK